MWNTISEKLFEVPIVSLTNTNEINGNFSLGSGYISTDRVYIYRYKTDDGGIKENHTYTPWTTIYETDSNFRVESYENLLKCKYTFTTEHDKQRYSYKIYVPKNTVIQEFSVK